MQRYKIIVAIVILAAGSALLRAQVNSVTGRTYVVVGTSPLIVGTDVQAAKAAAQTPKTVFATGAATAIYRFSGTVGCTTTSAAATVLVSLIYTDSSSTAVTLPSAVATCTTNTSVGPQDASFSWTFSAKNGTNIQYSTTIVNTPTYDVRVVVEQLGAS